MTWKILNLEKYQKEHPVTFFLQPIEDRRNLKPGDFARLHFAEDDAAINVWVEVKEVKRDGKYVGIISERAVSLDPLAFGDSVTFGPQHVGETRGPEDLSHPAPWNYSLEGRRERH